MPPKSPAFQVRLALLAALVLPALPVALAGCGQATTKAAERPAGSADAAGHRTGAPVAGDLPQATTHATLTGAPLDEHSFDGWSGTVAHPNRTVTVYAKPDGAALAELPSEQVGGPTWVPVVETAPGWQRVLLPSRPNRSTGWIRTGDGAVRTARSSYLIEVWTTARRLMLSRAGKPVGNWPVAVGAPNTPTPVGRTFVLASLAPADRSPSPLVLPLGTHSETLENFGGGPGTVAFHGWPDSSVFGSAVTHGCVRVPSAALRALSRVPLGTVVVINR